MADIRYSAAAGPRYKLVLDLLRAESPPPADVVEFGAAPGEQSVGLATAGYAVTALDIGVASDAWEAVPEGTMTTRFAATGVKLVVWDLEETPYPLADETFDAVIMTEVFEHLREYPITALYEARRILRPGGCLYLTTPNATYIGKRVRFLLGHNVATALPDWIGGLPFARHAREYTFAEMHELLDLAGFDVTLSTGRHLHIDSGRQSLPARGAKVLLDRLARARPSLGPAIVVVARRRAGSQQATGHLAS